MFGQTQTGSTPRRCEVEAVAVGNAGWGGLASARDEGLPTQRLGRRFHRQCGGCGRCRAARNDGMVAEDIPEVLLEFHIAGGNFAERGDGGLVAAGGHRAGGPREQLLRPADSQNGKREAVLRVGTAVFNCHSRHTQARNTPTLGRQTRGRPTLSPEGTLRLGATSLPALAS